MRGRWIASLFAAIALALTRVAGAAPARAPAGFDYAHAPKVALVIGNGDYKAWPRLRNAPADAELMARTFTRLGYRTEQLHDADRAAFNQALGRLTDALRHGGVAMVYFAGHGVQSQRVNYLLPVDAGAFDAARLPSEGMPVDELLRQLRVSGAQASLVLLDACRDDPDVAVTRGGARVRWRGASREGFADPARVAPGMLVAYATQPGERAEDGSSGHSPFATALARWLPEPALPLGEAMQQVQRDVRAATEDGQRPLIESTLVADFALVPGQAAAAAATPGPAAVATAAAPSTPLLWFQTADQTRLMNLTADIDHRAGLLDADALPELEHQARHGSAVAQAVLGEAWREGFGVGAQKRRSARQAQVWLRMAARQHMPYAQTELAEMLYRGEGGERRVAEARTLFEAAAAQGYQPAKLDLLQLDLEQGATDPDALRRALQGFKF